MEILARCTTFLPDQAVSFEFDPPAATGCTLQVSHLGEVVTDTSCSGQGITLGLYPEGGYGVDVWSADGRLLGSTAFDVLSNPLQRPRYGFVAHDSADIDVVALQRFARKFHLNAIQHYDWVYSYTTLVGPSDAYVDMLGNEVDVATLRAMIRAYHDCGAHAMGYAALYAIPSRDRAEWADVALFRADGTPYGFGDDFLDVVDPGAPRWRQVIIPAIADAYHEIGFDGFHLDQYGWPKFALRADGSTADLAESLPALVDELAQAVPGAELIFNNVNGFPLERTAACDQAALYTEVWPPRVELRDLAQLVQESRAAGDLPVIIAAYATVFHEVGGQAARDALRLTMATIFSSGASHLLLGEDGKILVHPYYVQCDPLDPETSDLMANWYDFLVRYGDLLLPRTVQDVTAALACEYNGDVVIEAPEGVRVSVHPDAGTIWLRVMRVDDDLVVHLVNLTGQPEAGWDTPKQPIEKVTGLRLRARQPAHQPAPMVWFDPDQPGPGQNVPSQSDGVDQIAELPALDAWAVIRLKMKEGVR